MSDYGIRISKKDVDVKTGSDKDMVVTSKYANLKGTISGSGTITTSGYVASVTIYHGLGYIPIMRGLSSQDGFSFENIPNQFGTSTVDQSVYCYADTNNAYIKFYFNSLGYEGTFDYKYFIFIDKGKL